MRAALLVLFSAATCRGAVFFSEYYDAETKWVDYKEVRFNKYVEIYNSGPNTVNLANYFVGVAHNGFSAFKVATLPEVALAAGGVYVVAHEPAHRDVAEKANLQTKAIYFNGNDAVCLLKGTKFDYEVLDCIGALRQDPGAEVGWSVCGTPGATNEMQLIRKGTVTKGNKGQWAISSAPKTCEWDIFVNTVQIPDGGLGSHLILDKDCECYDDGARAGFARATSGDAMAPGAPARRQLSGAGAGAGKPAAADPGARSIDRQLQAREQGRVAALAGAAIRLFGGASGASAGRAGRQLLFGGASFLPPCPARMC